jgi:hypothetical protein
MPLSSNSKSNPANASLCCLGQPNGFVRNLSKHFHD